MRTRLTRNDKHQRRRTIVGNLLLILAALLVGLFVWSYQDIFGLKLFKNGKNINIVFDTSPLILFSLDMAREDAVALVIPPDVYLSVPYGYGLYKAGSVYSLGELDPKRGGGGPLLSSAISQTIGVPLDGYIHLKNKSDWKLSTSDDFLSFKRRFLTLPNLGLFSQITTNLTLPEFIRFWIALSGLRGDGFQFINLDFPSLSIKQTLPDGSAVLSIDPDALDKKIEGVFEEKKIRDENISISVLNATSQEGIGTMVARILTHIGSRVVMVGNYDGKESDRCTLTYGAGVKGSFTVGRLKNLFGCKEKIGGDINSQSDVTLILGEGYLQ